MTSKMLQIRSGKEGKQGRARQDGACAVPRHRERRRTLRVLGLFDLMGGKPGCAFSLGLVSPTITRGRASVSDVHAIVYRADPLSSNSMKSNNPHSGFHKIEVSPCLDCTIPEPSKNQGGYRDTTILALDGDKWKPRKTYRPRRGGCGFGISSDGAGYTLNTVDRHIVAILNFKH